MGADCCNESKQDDNIVGGGSSAAVTSGGAPSTSAVAIQKDLPTISLDGKDAYEKFELSLPFYRTNIKTYEANIEKAHEACGGQDFVTIDALCKVFTTPAWAQLTQNDSKLCKVLLSNAFKTFTEDNDESTLTEEQIRVPALMCMGVLACGGTPKEKAEVFYGILQDGGMSSHTHISASDKDMEPTFKKMCGLSTIELFAWAHDITGFESPFVDQYNTLRDCHEDLREDVFLEAIYGNETKLDNDQWVKKIIETGKYIFNSKDLRKQIFKQCDIEYKL